MQTVKYAVIAAAGIGSRLGIDSPKCLLNVNGKPLIYYQLKLLEKIEQVRLIVGFKEKEVMNYVRSIRPDAIFVRNDQYLNTTQNYSYWLGAKDLATPYLLMDADLYIEPNSFNQFLSEWQGGDLIGYTCAKTKEAVYVELKEGNVVRFTRDEKLQHEWCNIAILSDMAIKPDSKFVYSDFAKSLPVKGKDIDVYEVDTQHDYEILEMNLNRLAKESSTVS